MGADRRGGPRPTAPGPALRVLGVRVDALPMADALMRVEATIAAARAGSLLPLHVVTINPEFVMRARQDPVFAKVLEQAGLCLPDGAGIVWAARRQRMRLQRVAGVDFVEAVAAAAARSGWRLFLLGAAPGVAGEAAAVLQARVGTPAIIAGTWEGGPGPQHDPEARRRIGAARPDVLFAAYGAPQQDLWIARNLSTLGVPVAAGVGGALDFIAGRARRAPAWLRRRGFEWAHRLWREPRRARRMVALPQFAVAVLRERRDAP